MLNNLLYLIIALLFIILLFIYFNNSKCYSENFAESIVKTGRKSVGSYCDKTEECDYTLQCIDNQCAGEN